MGLAFFGLTQDNAALVRVNLFRQLHSIIFHSKGSYDFYTIYNLPIWLRKFVFSEIDKFYKDEKQAYEKAKEGKDKTTLVDSSGKINAPEFVKASKPYKGKTNYK